MPRVNRRLKASDVSDQSLHLLGKTADFSKAFPKIEKVQVLVHEHGEGVTDLTAYRQITERSVGEYLNCSNPRCYNGGVRLGQILRFMEELGDDHLERSEYCQGYEGSPKGRVRDGPCENRFDLKINLVFKPKS